MERIWYSDNHQNSTADVIRYLRSKEPLSGKNVHCEQVETVLSSIGKPTEEILASATKTVRYEVNKCEKEGVALRFYSSDELRDHPEVVDEFEAAYLEFARSLNIEMVTKAYQRGKVDNGIETNTALLTKAEKDGVMVYHFYACGGKECCLEYSVSNYRDDATKRNLAGRMNKLLHVKDMEWFRDRGYELYDWGNINSSETPDGISKFKMSFGGLVVSLYNSFVGNTLKGKLLVSIMKMQSKKQ